MPIVPLIDTLLGISTLIIDIILILFFVFFIIKKITKKEISFTNKIWNFILKHALLFAFLFALLATAGSLFYSEIAHYTPCKLCWIQRIFMYPLTLILGIAWWKKDRTVKRYVMPMSLIGGLISIYHYGVQRFNFHTTCSANATVPCSIKYTFEYGYITIPMMALTAFIWIFILMKSLKNRKEEENMDIKES
tara:strand:- start:82 stop:657 length:576 start_codon:yes stop_codon:yes gene_type:complete